MKLMWKFDILITSATRRITLRYGVFIFLLLIFLFLPKPAYGFFSPSTLQLIGTTIGSSLWPIIAVPLASIFLLFKKINKDIRLIILFALVALSGGSLGVFSYRLTQLKKINKYLPLKLSDLNKISYDKCIKNNYLNFLPKENIILLSEDEAISFLLKNPSVNILNIGYGEKIRFKNEIFISQTDNELNEVFSRVDSLDKDEPLLIHCYGGAHSSSMVAQFLTRRGFSNIYLLQSNPEELYSSMNLLNIDTDEFFKITEKIVGEPIIRISINSGLNLMKKSDTFYFYMVRNCEEYINTYSVFNSKNTICSKEFYLDQIKRPIKSKVHFLCDEEKECSLLQTKLWLSNFKEKGYLVVLYE